MQGLMANRSYAILGTGAIGGYYGACLQRAGNNVHFLLHSDYERVRERGLVVESLQGDFTLPQVNAYSDVQKMPPCDVVVVALKTTQNHLLPKLLPPVMKEDGVVLVVQNGLGIEVAVADIVSAERVMGGLCFICSNKVGAGHIRHLDYGAIAIGDYAPHYHARGITERMRQIAADFEAAGIECQLSEDLLQTRWQKLVWNIPYNGLSVVLDATTDEMMENGEVRSLVEQIMQEVAMGARACEREISHRFIQGMLDHTEKMKPYRTSMKIDYDMKRPLEIEAIVGNPLRAAQTAGTELPLIAMLYKQLKFLDTKNRR
jgi:2-dehydropantoate 2-reductase